MMSNMVMQNRPSVIDNTSEFIAAMNAKAIKVDEFRRLQAGKKKKTRKPQQYKEETLQEKCVTWFDQHYPTLQKLFFHVPNEGKRKAAAAAHLIASGMRKGIPDMFLLLPSGQNSSMALEFKKPGYSPSDVRPEQREYAETLQKFSVAYHIISDFNQFMDIIGKYVPPIYLVDFNKPFKIKNGQLIQNK